MNDQTIKRVKELLATYHARERQISVLLYELDHAPRETPAEIISELAYAKSTGMCGMPRRKSTNYIAVNYKEQLKQVNVPAQAGARKTQLLYVALGAAQSRCS